jgi:hypothetical protein
MREEPHRASSVSDADGAMPVFHGRIGFRPFQASLPHLQRRLVRQSDGPTGPQARELRSLKQAGWQIGHHGLVGLPDDGLEVLTQARPKQGERGDGEAGLHHRPFIDEVEHNPLIGSVEHGGRGGPP